MIPLAAVTTTIRDTLGNPVAGAKVSAKLSAIDLYNGEYVYPVEQTFVADVNGLVTMNLFPNALGEKNTVYTVKATDAAGDNTYLNTTCVVPNAATTLNAIEGTGPVTPQNTYVGSPIAIPFYDQLQKYQSYLKNFNTGVRNYIFPDVSGVVPVLNAAVTIGVSAGLLSLTPAGDINARTLQQPAAGITIANANGVAGNPTFALANDLAALEGIALTGMAARTAGDTWAVRTITGTANQISVSNGDGVLGNPTLSLPQNIHTGATPTFGGMTLQGSANTFLIVASTGANLAGAQFRYNTSSVSGAIYGNASGQVIVEAGGTTTVGTWSGSGLAVTGTLSATGLISTTVTNESFRAAGATTGARSIRLGNTGNDVYFGTEGSVGGGFFTGASNYATVVYSSSPVETIIGVNKITTVNGTGLGVFTSPSWELHVSLSKNGSPMRGMVENTANTAGSDARLIARTTGASSGDPQLVLDSNGAGVNWFLSADTSGSGKFVVSKNGVAGSGADYLAIDTSGNIYTASDGLYLQNTNATIRGGTNAGADNFIIGRAQGANFHAFGSAAGDLVIAPEATKRIVMGTSTSAGVAGTGRLVIDSTGGISALPVGTGAQFNIANASLSGNLSLTVGKANSSGNTTVLGFNNSGSTYGFVEVWGGGAPLALQSGGGNVFIGSTAAVLGSCRLEVITSGVSQTAFTGQVDQALSNVIVAWNKATAGDNLFATFATEAGLTVRGTIDYNRAGGAVRYNTTSDYRLKIDHGAFDPVDARSTLSLLQIHKAQMIDGTQIRPMFMAHEAQDLVPYAVGGEKDEIGPDFKPRYQTMDHSILVPLLTVGWQDHEARLRAVEKHLGLVQ